MSLQADLSFMQFTLKSAALTPKFPEFTLKFFRKKYAVSLPYKTKRRTRQLLLQNAFYGKE